MTEHEDKGVENEMLMALADGELDDAEAKALMRRIERNPQLAARYASFAQTAEALRAAFARGEMPAHLINAVRSAPGEAVIPRRRSERKILTAAFEFLGLLAQPAAVAAMLAAGVGLGWVLRGDGDGPSAGLDQRTMAAAVSDMPTGETREVAGGGTVRVLGSFQTARGLCRLILTDTLPTGGARFVACRNDADWQVMVSVAEAGESGFAPASATATEAIDLYLDAIGAGAALSAEAEAAELE